MINSSVSSKKVSYQSDHEAPRYPYQASDFVDNLLNNIGFGMFQIVAFFFVGATYVAYVCEVLTFAFISIPVMNEWHLSPLTFSSVAASTFVGNMLGETILSYIADKYGRFWPYLISLIFIASLVLASAFVTTFYAFLLLRMFASVGVGGVIILALPSLMEFLPVSRRGNVTILTSLIVAFASCVTAGVAWWLNDPSYGDWGWRYYIVSTAIPSFFAILFRLIFFIESPRFLVSKGEFEKAWHTFRIMAKINCKNIEEFISREQFIKECSSYSPSDQEKTFHSLLLQFSHILKPPFLHQTVCLAIIYSFQIMTVYGTTLFLPYNLKLLGINPYVCSFIAFVAEIPGILFLSIIIEWPEFGRKNTIRISSFISAVLYFLFAFVQNEISIPVLTVLLYFFIVPVTTVILIYVAESYPTEIRTMSLAFMGNIASILSIGLVFGAGYLAELSADYTWLTPTVWGSMFIFQFIITLFLKHETRGRNLQDNIINGS